MGIGNAQLGTQNHGDEPFPDHQRSVVLQRRRDHLVYQAASDCHIYRASDGDESLDVGSGKGALSRRALTRDHHLARYGFLTGVHAVKVHTAGKRGTAVIARVEAN